MTGIIFPLLFVAFLPVVRCLASLSVYLPPRFNLSGLPQRQLSVRRGPCRVQGSPELPCLQAVLLPLRRAQGEQRQRRFNSNWYFDTPSGESYIRVSSPRWILLTTPLRRQTILASTRREDVTWLSPLLNTSGGGLCVVFMFSCFHAGGGGKSFH